MQPSNGGTVRSFTSAGLRAMMSRFVTGVTVVTTVGPDGPHGVTVNSFTSVSLNPPLVMAALLTEARSARYVLHAGTFAVNILGPDQADIGSWFSRPDRPRGADAFKEIPYRVGETGSPLLDGTVGHLDCRLASSFPAGDHTIFLGEVVDLGGEANPGSLVFHRGRFVSLP